MLWGFNRKRKKQKLTIPSPTVPEVVSRDLVSIKIEKTEWGVSKDNDGFKNAKAGGGYIYISEDPNGDEFLVRGVIYYTLYFDRLNDKFIVNTKHYGSVDKSKLYGEEYFKMRQEQAAMNMKLLKKRDAEKSHSTTDLPGETIEEKAQAKDKIDRSREELFDSP